MSHPTRDLRWWIWEAEDRLAKAVARRSPHLAAAIDWLFPVSHAGIGHAMNGQRARQATTRCLLRLLKPEAIVETGSYRAITSRFLRKESRRPVHSAEANPRYYIFSRWKTRRDSDIHIYNVDSRAFLRSLAGEASFPKERVFFYLDAHWEDDLPLAEELMLISDHWTRSIVMVDDFQVEDDPGYGFDDYGPGQRLDSEYIPWGNVEDWQAYFPSVASQDETGAKRGSIVLVSPGIALGDEWLRRCRLRAR